MDELDYRYINFAKFVLMNKFRIVKILDLCSGNTRLPFYFGDFQLYDAVDTRKPNIMPPRINFYNCTDQEYVDSVYSNPEYVHPDCVVCFGIGGFELSGEVLESSTVMNNLRYIITNSKPRIIVLECIMDYVSLMDTFNDLLIDYKCLFSEYSSNDGGRVFNRVMKIWVRND